MNLLLGLLMAAYNFWSNMTKGLMKKWVKALRSGKFLQGKKKLLQKNDGKESYCCLGVLGSVCGVDTDTLSRYDTLEDTLADECEMSSSDGEVLDNGDSLVELRVRVRGSGNEFRTFDNLAAANDSGATFRSLASWIEKYYEHL
jgi:hypothetical protein